MIKIIQNAKENGMMVISILAIPVYINPLPEGLRLLEKNGIHLIALADLKT